MSRNAGVLGDLPLTLILFALTAGALAHLALFFIGARINPAFLLAAAFFVLSPFSAAKELPFVVLLKYVRVYVSLLLVPVGALVRMPRLGLAGGAFLFFVMFYWLAGVWSDAPGTALVFKGLYAMTSVGGMVAGYSLRSDRDLEVGMRCLGLSTAAFAALLVANWIGNPAALSHLGRLEPLGMNANRVGQIAAMMSLVSLFVALHDSSRLWRALAFSLVGFLALVVLYSGSRASAALLLVGSFALLLPMARRAGLLILAFLLIGGAGAIGAAMLESYQTERFTDVSLTSRELPWGLAMDYFRDAPLMGQGWVYTEAEAGNRTTQNLHSVPMQILAETGIVGATVLGLMVFFVGVAWLQTRGVARRNRALRPAASLADALLIAILVHALFESGTVTGATLTALMSGVAIGLLDRVRGTSLPVKASVRRAARSQTAEPALLADEPASVRPMSSL